VAATRRQQRAAADISHHTDQLGQGLARRYTEGQGCISGSNNKKTQAPMGLPAANKVHVVARSAL
jgi:hypothetical protein